MIPTIHRVPVNRDASVTFSEHHHGTNYQRNQYHKCLTGIVTLKFERTRWTSGSVGAFEAQRYDLVCGATLATFTHSGSANIGSFTFDGRSMPDGPWMLEIKARNLDGTPRATVETQIPWWVWIDNNGTAKDHPSVIFQNGSWDWTHGDRDYLWAIVDKEQLRTRTRALGFRRKPSVDTAINSVSPGVFFGGEPITTCPTMVDSNGRPLANAAIRTTRLNWAITTDNGQMCHNRPSITKRGITVTENNQAYAGYDFYRKTPNKPLLDGPRGVGAVADVTAIWMGHGGSVYGMDPFSFWRINFDGVVHRFAGLRHKWSPYWNDGSMVGIALETVGDWDASIPLDQRFPWESWALFADIRPPLHDMALPFKNIPPFGPLPQHDGIGPRFFATCRFGRLLCFQFDKSNPSAPPKVSVWVSGLSDPWGAAMDEQGIIYIAERGRDAISMWSADTPQMPLGDLISGAHLGRVGDPDTGALRRWAPNAGVTRAQIQAEAIQAPEGLAYQDGHIYFGSFAQANVKRINLSTRAIQICVAQVPHIKGDLSGQPKFIHVALSDGTFGTRGTIFTSTGDNQTMGRAIAWQPIAGVGVDIDGAPVNVTHATRWTWHGYVPGAIQGCGGSASQVYSYATGIANGMLACGGSSYGLDVFVRSAAGEPLPDEARLQRGASYYLSKGYRLIFGNYGWGHIDAPLPWGEQPDMDYWLEWSGHVRVDPCADLVAARDAAAVARDVASAAVDAATSVWNQTEIALDEAEAALAACRAANP